VARPIRIASPAAAKAGEGIVLADLGRGSVLLVPERDGVGAHRLVWGEKDAKDRQRAVPAGTWYVRNYKVIRTDELGVEWQVWGSLAKGRKVIVPESGQVSLEFDLAVHVAPQAKEHHGKLQIGIGVKGDSGMGLTVLRKGDRVPATYAIRRQGARLISGSLNYG
jgi:hypothetical protein